MANLTGEYDVVTEAGVGLVNAIVAAIHENEDDEYPTLPHSLTVHVDDVFRGATDPVPEEERTGIRTKAELQLSTPVVSLPVAGVADSIWSQSPARLRAVVHPGPHAPPTGPVDPGGQPTSRLTVTARLRLRAWLRDRPDELPEFLHGDLQMTAGVVRTDLAGLGTFLGLDHGSGLVVRFDPAVGTTLSQDERGVVERILRNFLRGDAEPVSFRLALPKEVRGFDFALQPTGPRPSALLMFTLSDRPPGPQGPGSVSASFLPPGADFAVAVGRDYLLGVLATELLRGVADEYTASGTGYHVRIRPDWAHATFDMQTGRIVLSVSGGGSITYGFGPARTTDEFSFTIRVALSLHIVEGALKPALAGDPEVELHDVAVFEGTIRDKARDSIKDEVQRHLEPPSSQLRQALDVASQLESIIAALHPSPPGVALTGGEIRPDGVVVAGSVALAPTRPVQVRRVALNGLADALESWIPGGTIARFVWGGGVEEHRFVAHKRPATAELRCLSVQGTRVTRGGGLVSVSAEECPVVVPVLPVFSGLPLIPSQRPLLPLLASAPDGRMEIVGHYDPWASGLVPTGGPTNLLVHFADGRGGEATRALEQVLATTRKRGVALVVIGVLGADQLAEAADVALDADVTLLLADDPAGCWASVFGISKAPATALIGPDGRLRWKDEAPLDAPSLDKVLDTELQAGGEVSWRPLRLAVAAGDPAPDAPLHLGDGRQLALRRLQGRSVVLSFWSSCSEPSVEQLRQLGKALESGRRDRPSVVGIGDGESPQQVAELAERERLPFPLVPDPERVIARSYGVAAWPATVQIGPGGNVEATDLGVVVE